jgi:mannose-1-phosphate guanylyltransferase/mannose-6-phosphate isomerase
LSRKSYPKQFSPIVGDKSLFQDCALRMSGPDYTPPVVMTDEDFRFVVTQQLEEIAVDAGMVMIEPDPRDTAPAILAAALHIAQDDPDRLMLVAPSDHLIPDHDIFDDTVRGAVAAAQAGQLVTFGINPERPEQGYGYLEVGDGRDPIRTLKRFVEKPDLHAAEQMLRDGNYLWNAGLFLFTARSLLAAFDTYAPDMRSMVAAALTDGEPDLGFFRLAEGPWSRVKATSIDYAIMEKATNLSVAPYGGSWSDLGDWAAVWRETEKLGVALSGEATAIDCDNVLLRSEVESQSIVGIGLQDIVAIAMPDAVLISHKDRAQDVKIAVQQLKSDGAIQAEVFPKDHRPWGWFESLATGDRFQVKRIVVNPSASLSLQSHHHRSEHWIVVAGTAKVTVGNNVELVTENQSIYIPLGTRHRLENPGKVPMILIEVQTGAYLGEDDIIRHEDVYARC